MTEPQEPIIAVIILTYNQRERTMACLESLLSAVGLPLMGVRILFREARRGNLGAIRGLLAGAWDLFDARTPARKQE